MEADILDKTFWTGFYEDDYFSWASDKAYLDMNRTMTFRKEGKSTKEKSDIDKERKSWRDCGTQIIKTHFQNIKCCDNFNFREWHKKLCDELIALYKSEPDSDSKLVRKNGNKRTNVEASLTYGQAQKWVNMTLKYLWMLGRLDMLNAEDSEIIKNHAKEFDIPLDSYILKYAAKAKKKSKETSSFEIPENTGLNSEVSFKSLGGYEWSKINNYKDYQEYQKTLKDKIQQELPLLWELEHWHKAIAFYGEQ